MAMAPSSSLVAVQITVDVDGVRHEKKMDCKGQLFHAHEDIINHAKHLYALGLLIASAAIWIKEWVDHGEINGVSTQMVLWCIVTYSLAIKRNLTALESATVRKIIPVQLVPACPTAAMHQKYAAMRLKLLMHLKALVNVSDNRWQMMVKCRLREGCSDGKASQHENSQKSGGKQPCSECEGWIIEYCDYGKSSKAPHRSMLIGLERYIAGQEPGCARTRIDDEGYVDVPAVLSGLKMSCDCTFSGNAVQVVCQQYIDAGAPDGAFSLRGALRTGLRSVAYKDYESFCEWMHGIQRTSKHLIIEAKKKMSPADRDVWPIYI